MPVTPFYKRSQGTQYLLVLLAVGLLSWLCYLLPDSLGYKLVALLLLCLVSVLAMFLDIFPVLLAAVLSALVWDFFFIPPRFTFLVRDTEDLLLLSLYFFIALLNAVLNYKSREW